MHVHGLNVAGIAFMQIQQVSQEQLEKELADRKVPLIIDFYATWCGPCVLLAKELEQVHGCAHIAAIAARHVTQRYL